MGENLHESKTMWEATTLDKTLSRFPERRTEFKTESGIPVERLYTPDDVEGGPDSDGVARVARDGAEGQRHDGIGKRGVGADEHGFGHDRQKLGHRCNHIRL